MTCCLALCCSSGRRVPDNLHRESTWRREHRGSFAGWWSGPRGRGAPAPWWPPPGWRGPAGLGRWSDRNAGRHKLALLLAGTVLCKKYNSHVENKLLSEKLKLLLCKRLVGAGVFPCLNEESHCIAYLDLSISVWLQVSPLLGPRGPLVLLLVGPFVRPFVLKIWITNIQAFITNPMAPWDPLDAPLDPLGPPGPPSSTPLDP